MFGVIYGDFGQHPPEGLAGSARRDNAMRRASDRQRTTGKNATDIALVIDCHGSLHEASANSTGICLVGSDSDYTELAQSLREDKKSGYGFGEKKTPEALATRMTLPRFKKACSKFFVVEETA